MKKMLVLAVALVALPALASAATVNCTPGQYSGKLWSVDSGLNGKTGTLTVTKEGEKCVMKFKAEGASEIWEVSGNTLFQKEFDDSGKVLQEYKASLQGNNFVINCKDRAKNDCDAGIDYRNYWQLKTTPNEVIYTVYGVGSDKKADATAKAVKRHEFSFKMTPAGTTTPSTTPASTKTTTPSSK
jgi:hypothetical protein